MEEAYRELYKQYLCLRSLCLRQASLLHQLTSDLQKQQSPGSAVPNGESDLMSIPVQCTEEGTAGLHENLQPLSVRRKTPVVQRDIDGPSRNVGIFSDVLAKDMATLCVDMPSQKKEDAHYEEKMAPLLSVASPRWQAKASNIIKNPGQARHRCWDRTIHSATMPSTDNPIPIFDFLNPAEGMLISDVALQSQVCEFCQAVFPGNTTTRGEFLRHLHTHVT